MYFYVIQYESGNMEYKHFDSDAEALLFAESLGGRFSIKRYDSEADYYGNL